VNCATICPSIGRRAAIHCWLVIPVSISTPASVSMLIAVPRT
jgi:hypothetical protein